MSLSPLRIAFLLVFVAAVIGFVIARSAVSSISAAPQLADVPLDTPQPSPSPTHVATPSPVPVPAKPSPTARVASPTPQPSATTVPSATSVPRVVPTATPMVRKVSSPSATNHRSRKHRTRSRPKKQVRSTATPRPSATPRPRRTATPRPTATSGVTTLTNYWIGETAARRGATISVGYTIDNGTGTTERVMLGASIKPSTVTTWGRSISDPYHDVVAVVPPGISTHVRYFTLSRGLNPGHYDVAWGLRDAATGEPVALVSASGSLAVAK